MSRSLCSFQNGSADTSNFDEEFTREQPTLTPVHAQLSSRDQAEFNGFSWVSWILIHDRPKSYDFAVLLGCKLGRGMKLQLP